MIFLTMYPILILPIKLIIRVVLVLSIALSVASCDFDNPVEYELSCSNIDCPNADDTSSFSSGNDRAFSCIWHCADWKGDSGVYVDLTFGKVHCRPSQGPNVII